MSDNEVQLEPLIAENGTHNTYGTDNVDVEGTVIEMEYESTRSSGNGYTSHKGMNNTS